VATGCWRASNPDGVLVEFAVHLLDRVFLADDALGQSAVVVH
jgi:hypothetical protein